MRHVPRPPREDNRVQYQLPFDSDARSNAMLLSHAHIDHSGIIPILCRERVSRPDLLHGRHRGFVQHHAARHGAHPRTRRGVPEQEECKKGVAAYRAALHASRCAGVAQTVPARPLPTAHGHRGRRDGHVDRRRAHPRLGPRGAGPRRRRAARSGSHSAATSVAATAIFSATPNIRRAWTS